MINLRGGTNTTEMIETDSITKAGHMIQAEVLIETVRTLDRIDYRDNRNRGKYSIGDRRNFQG